MMRQCAWCLRLIDIVGKRLSTQPLPKLYEASHGMCSVCGTAWMEQVLSSLTPQIPPLYFEDYCSQEDKPVPQDVSSVPDVVDLSLHYPDSSVGSVVCEHCSDYSPLTRYPLIEKPECCALDNGILEQDLTVTSYVTTPAENMEMSVDVIVTDVDLLQNTSLN